MIRSGMIFDPHTKGKIAFDARLDISPLFTMTRSIREMTSKNIDDIVENFNEFGFSIIDCGENAISRDDFLHLQQLFGRPLTHPRADVDGIVPINSFDPVPGHLDSTNDEHLLHTDGSFSADPGHILILQCSTASRIGGLSLVASGHAAYLHLKELFPDEHHLVHGTDAIEIIRNEQSAKAPLFDRANGRSRIRFRYRDGAAMVIPKPSVAHLYETICNFFQDPANIITFQLHPNQVLIADNGALVHGRTRYPNHQPRDMRRLNLDGNGTLRDRLQFGFEVPAAPTSRSLAS